MSTAISTCGCSFQNRVHEGGDHRWSLVVALCQGVRARDGRRYTGEEDTAGGCSRHLQRMLLCLQDCARVMKESSSKQTQYSLWSPQRMVPTIYVSIVSLD